MREQIKNEIDNKISKFHITDIPINIRYIDELINDDNILSCSYTLDELKYYRKMLRKELRKRKNEQKS